MISRGFVSGVHKEHKSIRKRPSRKISREKSKWPINIVKKIFNLINDQGNEI